MLYFEYKNNRHLTNTYILVHLHFTVFHVRVVLRFTAESGKIKYISSCKL